MNPMIEGYNVARGDNNCCVVGKNVEV